MELLGIVQAIVVSVILATIAYQLSGSDWSKPRKVARVRVWVDEKRRHPTPGSPEEENYDAQPDSEWLILGFVLLMLFSIILAFVAG